MTAISQHNGAEAHYTWRDRSLREKETAAADVNICSPKKVFTNFAGVKEHEVIASISQLPAVSMGKVSFPPMGWVRVSGLYLTLGSRLPNKLWLFKM